MVAGEVRRRSCPSARGDLGEGDADAVHGRSIRDDPAGTSGEPALGRHAATVPWRNVTAPRAGARLPGTRAHRDRSRAASAPPRSPDREAERSGHGAQRRSWEHVPITQVVAPLAALLASAAIVFAACGGTRRRRPRPSAAPARQPARHRRRPRARAPFEAMAYPETGEAPCGQAEAPDADAFRLHRQLQEDQRDRREDRRLRAVQPGRRVPVEDRVHLVRHQRHGVARVEDRPGQGGQPGDRRPRSTAPGPTSSRPGTAAPTSPWPATTPTGATRPRPRSSISAGAPRPHSGCVELQAGTVDGIDNSGRRLRHGRGQRRPAARSRARASTPSTSA